MELICSETGATVHAWPRPTDYHLVGSRVRNAVAKCGTVVKRAYVFGSVNDVDGDYVKCPKCNHERLDLAFIKKVAR